MDPTTAQRERMTRLRRDFGGAVGTVHGPDRVTGHVRVELSCVAGTWDWWIDTAGEFVTGALRGRLCEMEPAREPARNAIDN